MITAFKQTKNTDIKKSILLTLWFSCTCVGDSFLKSLNNSQTESKEVIDYANRILRDTKIDREYKKLLKKITAAEMESLKQSALRSFSDEAIYDLEFVIKEKRKGLNCL